MSKCPIKDQKYKDLEKSMKSAEKAKYAYISNNGHSMDLASNGAESNLYKDMLGSVGMYTAMRMKAMTFSDSFREQTKTVPRDENGEVKWKWVKHLFVTKNQTEITRESKTKVEIRSFWDNHADRAPEFKSEGSLEKISVSRFDKDYAAMERVATKIINQGEFQMLFIPSRISTHSSKFGTTSIKSVMDEYDAKMKKEREEGLSEELPGFTSPTKRQIFTEGVIHKKDTINLLYERLRKYKDEPIEQKKIYDQIAKVDQELVDMKMPVTLSQVIEAGEAEIKAAKLMLKDIEIGSHDAQKAIDYVNHVSRTLEFWGSDEILNNIIDPENISLEDREEIDDYQKRIRVLRGEAEELRRKSIKIAEKAVTSIAKTQWGDEITSAELYAAAEDISLLGAQMRDISTAGIALADLMDSVKREAAARSDMEAQKLFTKINNMFFDKKGSPKHSKEVYQKFIRDDGNLRTRFTQEYYDKKASLIPKEGTKNKGAQWKKFFKWKKNNEIVFDVRKLFFADYNKMTGKESFTEEQRLEHIAELKKHLGEKGFNKHMENLESKVKNYQVLENEVRLNFEEDLTDDQGRVDNAKVEVEMRAWEMQNSPFMYMDIVEERIKNVDNNGHYVNPRGGKYTEVVARKTTPDGKPTKWYDGEFAQIENNSEYLKLYEFMTSTLNDLYSNLPLNIQRTLHMNHFPELKKSFVESFTDDNMMDVSQGISGNILSQFLVDDTGTQMHEVVDPITRKKRLRLSPSRMVEGTLAKDERSFDLPKVMKTYALMNLSYKHKAKVEDSVRAIYHQFRLLKERQENSAGREKTEKDTRKIWQTTGLKHASSQMEYAYETFFDVTRAENPGKNKVLSKKEKERKKILKAEILLNDQKYDKGEISNEEYQELNEAAQTELENLGSYVDLTKIGDSLLQFTQLKGMGWNVLGSVTNASFGIVSNAIEGSRGEFFTKKDHRASLGMLMTPGSKRDKLMMLMLKFNVLKDFSEEAKTSIKTMGVKSAYNKFKPYFLQKAAEQIAHGNTLGATMLSTTAKKNWAVEDLNGKTRPLFDAFDVDGNWNVKEFGENTAWDGNPENYNHNKELIKFRGFMDQLNKKIHGNYDPNSRVRIKRVFLGRATMQFRSWMAEGFSSRFEGERYDRLLDTRVKGRYRSYGAYYKQYGAIKGSFKITTDLLKGFMGGTMNYNSDLDQLDQMNMQANLAELRITLMLMAVGFMLQHMSDDDEENKKLTIFALNVLNRLQVDVMFYSSPSAMKALTRGTIIPAAAATLEDGAKVIEALIKLSQGEDEMSTGAYSGESRTAKSLLRLFPFTSAGYRVHAASNALFQR